MGCVVNLLSPDGAMKPTSGKTKGRFYVADVLKRIRREVPTCWAEVRDAELKTPDPWPT